MYIQIVSNNEFAAEKLIDSLDQSYATEWAAETTGWNRLGIYELLASHVDLQENGTHLDVGSGLGILLSQLHAKSLKEKNPQRFYGIEANLELLRASAMILNEKQVPILVACARIPNAEQTPEGIKISRSFVYHEQFDKQALLRPNVVNLIGDDVRSATVIREILSDRKITSGSFTFPGPGSLIYEKPYALVNEFTDEEKKKRTEQSSENLRKSTYALMTSLMDEGGKLMLAERFPRVPNMSNNQIIDGLMITVRSLFGNLISYWDVENIQISNGIIPLEGKMEWLLQGHKTSALEKQGVSFGVSIVKLVRNMKKYLW